MFYAPCVYTHVRPAPLRKIARDQNMTNYKGVSDLTQSFLGLLLYELYCDPAGCGIVLT